MLPLLKFKGRKDKQDQSTRNNMIISEPDERQPLAYTGQAFSDINQVNGDVKYQVQADGNRRHSPENQNITQVG